MYLLGVFGCFEMKPGSYWDPEIEYYRKLSSHAQIPHGAENLKLLKKTI